MGCLLKLPFECDVSQPAAHTCVQATSDIAPAAMGGHGSHSGDVSQLAADGGNVSQLAADGGNVSQLATNAVRLTTSMLIGIRQQETAEGSPRSLHKLARDVLNQIHQNQTFPICCVKL